MYRKVPPKHWEWITPWMSPEATRGESLCPLTDVYSFCCLVNTYQYIFKLEGDQTNNILLFKVWEMFYEERPWCDLDGNEIREMWTRQATMRTSGRLLLDTPCIPLKINRFLQVGLQPELDRRNIDLQEIYLMLRIQASAIQKSQPKMEMHQQKSSK